MTNEEIEFNVSGSALLMMMCDKDLTFDEAYAEATKEFKEMQEESWL